METTPPKKKRYAFPILLALTIVTALFWSVGLNTDVYANAFIGAVFEILWLPIMVFTALVPMICLVYWTRRRLSLKSGFFYLLLASSAIVYFVVTTSN